MTSGVTGREVSIGAEVSSQFISALLLCAPAFPEGLDLTLVGTPVSQPYIDMTIAVMEAFGASVDATPGRIVVGATGYDAMTYAIEPDASTATYPLAAAAIVGGRVTVLGLGSASLQGDAEFANRVLEPMGANVFIDEDSIEVRGSGLLDPLSVDLGDMSDTAPTFAALASKATGTSAVTGIGSSARPKNPIACRRRSTSSIVSVSTSASTTMASLSSEARTRQRPSRPTKITAWPWLSPSSG